MLKALLPAGLAVILASCAAAPEPASAAGGLSEEAFKALLNTTYNTRPAERGDKIATEMLARTDLTTDQRAEVLYRRATMRGSMIGDWADAYPQCAIGDYLELLRIAPNHRLAQQSKDGIVYQVGRRQYFNQAPFLGSPEWCAPFLEEGLRFVNSNQGR